MIVGAAERRGVHERQHVEELRDAVNMIERALLCALLVDSELHWKRREDHRRSQ